MASILKLDTLQTPSGTGVITSLNTIASPGSVIQVQSVTDGTSFTISTSATAQFYYTLGTAVTIISKVANSKFLVIGTAPYYFDGVNQGVALGIKANGVLIIGTDGGSGDSWTMGGNTVTNAGSGNLTRVHQHAPNAPAGTSITFALAGATWVRGSGNGNAFFNYAGYSTKSNITVMEIAQ